jgi:hypothetical protein
LIDALGSVDLIAVWPSTNHLSSAALALPTAATRATEATTKEAIKVRIFVFINVPFSIGSGPSLASFQRSGKTKGWEIQYARRFAKIPLH